jgi:hypothetical protein
LNRTTIRLIRSKNLNQNDFPSLRLPKSDRLLDDLNHQRVLRLIKRIFEYQATSGFYDNLHSNDKICGIGHYLELGKPFFKDELQP